MRFVLIFLCLLPQIVAAQSTYKSFAEFGTTVHTGDNTPLWQVSNQHGLSSLDNNAYIRGGGTFCSDTCKQWKLNSGFDLAIARGFTSNVVIQQAYADIYYKWMGLSVGSKEINSELLNSQLSSGGLTWSGNARPIPQIKIGFLNYKRLNSCCINKCIQCQ